MSADRFTMNYFRHGLEYYTSARYAAKSAFIPVCGLLAHYAIEMLLKGQLSVGHTEDNLKKIGHDLNAAWVAFKAEFPASDLTRFDTTIAEINRFWRIRYPEKLVVEGMQCSVDWSGVAGDHRPISLDPSAPSIPRYHLSLHDLDALVLSIFELCRVNPAFFLNGMCDDARTYLYFSNAFFKP
jgi:hypothetical protein